MIFLLADGRMSQTELQVPHKLGDLLERTPERIPATLRGPSDNANSIVQTFETLAGQTLIASRPVSILIIYNYLSSRCHGDLYLFIFYL